MSRGLGKVEKELLAEVERLGSIIVAPSGMDRSEAETRRRAARSLNRKGLASLRRASQGRRFSILYSLDAAKRKDENQAERQLRESWEKRKEADREEWDAWRQTSRAKRGDELTRYRESTSAPEITITVHRLRGMDTIDELFVDHLNTMTTPWRFTNPHRDAHGDIVASARLDVDAEEFHDPETSE